MKNKEKYEYLEVLGVDDGSFIEENREWDDVLTQTLEGGMYSVEKKMNPSSGKFLDITWEMVTDNDG